VPDEEFVKFGKAGEGDDRMRTERDGAVVFTRLNEFVDESEEYNEVLLETNYEGFCLA
jgi:hypothetical protein